MPPVGRLHPRARPAPPASGAPPAGGRAPRDCVVPPAPCTSPRCGARADSRPVNLPQLLGVAAVPEGAGLVAASAAAAVALCSLEPRRRAWGMLAALVLAGLALLPLVHAKITERPAFAAAGAAAGVLVVAILAVLF